MYAQLRPCLHLVSLGRYGNGTVDVDVEIGSVCCSIINKVGWVMGLDNSVICEVG